MFSRRQTSRGTNRGSFAPATGVVATPPPPAHDMYTVPLEGRLKVYGSVPDNQIMGVGQLAHESGPKRSWHKHLPVEMAKVISPVFGTREYSILTEPNGPPIVARHPDTGEVCLYFVDLETRHAVLSKVPVTALLIHVTLAKGFTQRESGRPRLLQE